PRARMAAIANEESSSSASIAPLAAMIAETPQTADPTASSVVNFGFSLNRRPSRVMRSNDPVISTTTRPRLMPPSLSTSPTTNRDPSSTMPAFNQNSYVAIPG